MSAKVAKFCLKYFDHKPKQTEMQSLFGCKIKLDTILINRNIGWQKFSRFGANFASFVIFSVQKNSRKLPKNWPKSKFRQCGQCIRRIILSCLLQLIQINGSNRHHLLSKQLLLNIIGLEINLHVLVKRSHPKHLLYRLKLRLQCRIIWDLLSQGPKLSHLSCFICPNQCF